LVASNFTDAQERRRAMLEDNGRLVSCFVVIASLSAAHAEPPADPPFINLASTAKISASSELIAQKLLARGVADGRIAPKGTGALEFYPATIEHARSWAVNGEEAEDRGDLVFEWKTPVDVEQLVYIARTAWLVEECWKDYEILVDDVAMPIAKGTFEKTDRPQRIRFERRSVRKLTMRFLNSYGGPNPGAAEVLVLGEDIRPAALRAFAPENPPREVNVDPIAVHDIVWRTPSSDAADAMPLGNGEFLGNVWVQENGDLRIDLARSVAGDSIERLGSLRLRMDPPLRVADESLRQALVLGRGAIQVAGQRQPEKPVFSIALDVNHPLLHVQLRTDEPVSLALEARDARDAVATAASEKARVSWVAEETRCVVLCDGMSVADDGEYRTFSKSKELDLQIHFVDRTTKPEAVAKTDVNSAVRAHAESWRRFWSHTSLFLDDGKDILGVDRALLLRRVLSAASGRGPHLAQLRSLDKTSSLESKKTASTQRPPLPWPEGRARKSFDSALRVLRDYAARGVGGSRFPRFWGADFSRLPAREEPVDAAVATLRGMLVASDGEKAWVLHAWPADQDVRFHAGASEDLSIDLEYRDGEIRRLEVHPKLRTGDVDGVGRLAAQVRKARAGPFRMPALVSYLSPSWVVDKAGPASLAVTMKDARFNGYEGTINDAAWCKKNGFFLLVHGANPWVAYELRNMPHVLTYFLSDRRKPNWFVHFGNQRKQYEAIAPRQATEFNTYAQYGGIEAFVDQVRPRVLEYYDYHWKRRADLHFHYLEHYRRMSIAAGHIPVFRYVHVHNDPVVRMRQTVSMSVVYGVKAIKWWVGWTMFDIHKVKENEPPPLSPIGFEVKRINSTLAAFSPYLARARSVSVHHTDPLPVSTRKAPEDSWVRASGQHAAVGVFENDEYPGVRFVAVGNRDIGEERAVALRFDASATKISRLDRKTGKFVDAKPRGESREVRLTLEPGDVELLRVD
jgi:hypothetical protein